MGVPSFYRWLVTKYPLVVTKAIEEKADFVDTSQPNPNGVEFDNLYLDMNGIIHQCFHPDDEISAPTTFQDVFSKVFSYIDRIFRIVRPRKLLYLAIDGVAPRAKMNQQRSRRFQTAKQNEISEAEEARLRRQLDMEGIPVLPKEESEVSDSNVITPGTEFMAKLSKALQGYITSRICDDEGWQDLKVILTDSNVPGEGEHKIMSLIRMNRSLPGYNPNTRHCLYGLDADLIMLALATHEIHFSILREGTLIQEDHVSVQDKSPSKKHFEFLRIWILREYLELDLQIQNLPENFNLDFERMVDDFVFMCFFAGNDFLPHLPTLEIHEGAIDLLMTVYKKEFESLGGYIVDMSKVEEKRTAFIKLSRVEKFIHLIGQHEDSIFKKRLLKRERLLRRLQRECEIERDKQRDEENGDFISDESGYCYDVQSWSSNIPVNNDLIENTRELKEKVKSIMKKRSDILKNCGFENKIKLGAPGNRYYEEKFCIGGAAEIECKRKELVQKYAEGLVWVLRYYYAGVSSWTWFYPYHYGPFASDFKGLSQVQIRFDKGVPFKPFTQLLAVLPPRSAHALPQAYAELMVDENSDIIDFYPHDFHVDLDGKRYLWQGICHLPFIDEGRLLSAAKRVEKGLTNEELERNSVRHDRLFFRNTNILVSQLHCSLQNESVCLDPNREGIGGTISFCCKNVDAANCVVDVCYKLPYSDPHIPRLLPHVNIPEKKIYEGDILETKLWHEDDFKQSSYGWKAKRENVEHGGASSRGWFPDQTHYIRKPNARNGDSDGPEGAGLQHGCRFRGQALAAGTGWSGMGRGRVRARARETVKSNAWGVFHGHGAMGTAGMQETVSTLSGCLATKLKGIGSPEASISRCSDESSMSAKPYRRGQFGKIAVSSSGSDQFDWRNRHSEPRDTQFSRGVGRAYRPASSNADATDSWRQGSGRSSGSFQNEPRRQHNSSHKWKSTDG